MFTYGLRPDPVRSQFANGGRVGWRLPGRAVRRIGLLRHVVSPVPAGCAAEIDEARSDGSKRVHELPAGTYTGDLLAIDRG